MSSLALMFELGYELCKAAWRVLRHGVAEPPAPPRPGEVYEHANGNRYVVLFITNTKHHNRRHAPQVVYRGANMDGLWSRPLSEWSLKMTLVGDQR